MYHCACVECVVHENAALSVLVASKNICHCLLQLRPKVDDDIAEEQKFDRRDAMPPVTKIERKPYGVGPEICTVADGNNV
jgi:hypothetical protein